MEREHVLLDCVVALNSAFALKEYFFDTIHLYKDSQTCITRYNVSKGNVMWVIVGGTKRKEGYNQAL